VTTGAELLAQNWRGRVRYSHWARRLRLLKDRGPFAEVVARFLEKTGRSLSRFSREDPKMISDASFNTLKDF
jgi:hypothetical protein